MGNKIKIIFDATPLAQNNRTGVGRTELGLITGLAAKYSNEIELVGHYFDFLGRKGNLGEYLPSASNIRYRRTILLPGKFFNMLRRLHCPVFYEILVKERGDFMLFPNFVGWPSIFKTPSAPFIHDITYIDYPKYVSWPLLYDLRRLVPRALKRSSFVITNTNSSRLGLERVYPWYKKPFVVAEIPLVGAVDLTQDEAEKRVTRLGIKGRYILFFGTLEPRKNLVGLLSAYKQLPSRQRSAISLVLGGGKGWKDAQIIDMIQGMKSKRYSIIETGYVSDEDRAALFMKASMMVLPSYYEGFGMQTLEAMHYGTPSLLSDIPVLREVAGGAALYCGTDPESIANGIKRLLRDKPLADELVKNGTDRIGEFSWDLVAEKLFKAIRATVEE